MRRCLKSGKGFTLVELLVAIGIFVFMTGLILSKYNTFNSGTLLTNTAYDVAVTIRQAQTYGVGVKATDPGATNFNSAYGVNFEPNSSQFKFFSDGDSSHSPDGYSGDGTNGDILISTYSLKRGARISSICVQMGNGHCSEISETGGNSLNIVFRRPTPNALICKNQGTCNSAASATSAEITVSSADGSGSRVIKINRTGQITVN